MLIPYPRETTDGIDEIELPDEKYNRKDKNKFKKEKKSLKEIRRKSCQLIF